MIREALMSTGDGGDRRDFTNDWQRYAIGAVAFTGLAAGFRRQVGVTRQILNGVHGAPPARAYFVLRLALMGFAGQQMRNRAREYRRLTREAYQDSNNN
jgi:hypothetical protein